MEGSENEELRKQLQGVGVCPLLWNVEALISLINRIILGGFS